MRRDELMLLVFYKEKAILNPTEFVLKFLEIWEKAGGAPLRLYRKNRPVEEALTESLLAPLLVFPKRYKAFQRVPLTLKSSLKKDGVVVRFLFEYPERSDPCFGVWRPPASSVSVNAPLRCARCKNGYTFQTLSPLLAALLSCKPAAQGSLSLSGESEPELDYEIYREILAVSPNPILTKGQLGWSTFFLDAEWQAVQQKFQQEGVSLSEFCRTHALEIQRLGEAGGVLLQMQNDLEGVAEHLRAVRDLNLDFYEILNRNG